MTCGDGCINRRKSWCRRICHCVLSSIKDIIKIHFFSLIFTMGTQFINIHKTVSHTRVAFRANSTISRKRCGFCGCRGCTLFTCGDESINRGKSWCRRICHCVLSSIKDIIKIYFFLKFSLKIDFKTYLLTIYIALREGRYDTRVSTSRISSKKRDC